MVKEMQSASVRGFDLETSGLRYCNGQEPIGYSVGYLREDGTHRAWYVPVRHQTPEPMAPYKVAQAAFRDALAGADALVGHNLKFDINMGKVHGFEIDPDVQLHDTMIQAYLIYERRKMKLELLAEDVVQHLPWSDPFEMANQVKAYLQNQAKLRRMTFKKSDKRAGVRSYMDAFGHAEVPVAIEGEYSCRDVAHALMLDRMQRDKAKGIGEPWQTQREYLYWNEMLLVRALAEMELTGQLVDKEYLLRLDAQTDSRLHHMSGELTRMFGAGINWRNDNEVRDLLYNHLRLPVLKMSKGGRTGKNKQPAVDRSALLLLGRSPVVPQHLKPGLVHLAEFNVWLKVWQTYTIGLAWWVDQDGRVHPGFKQTGTKTGRLSGENPNFQNIPVRHKEAARSIRLAFPVEDGMCRLYCDYSQVELRMLAWATGCKNLIKSYRSPAYDAYLRGDLTFDQYVEARRLEPKVDVHRDQAINTLGAFEPDHEDGCKCDQCHTWKVQRRAAKVVNFGTPYGMGPPGLMGNPELMLSQEEAESFFRQYHRGNPEINEAKSALFQKMMEHHPPRFISWSGRACHARELISKNSDIRSEGERSVFATHIQGAAGDLTRFSLVQLWLAWRAGRIVGKPTSTVHDEIQLDTPKEYAAEDARELRRIMEDFAGLFGNIPIVAELEKTETTWADKKEFHV